jgi:hypothetical protein
MNTLMVSDKYFFTNENIYKIYNKFNFINKKIIDKGNDKQITIPKPKSKTENDIFLSKFNFINEETDSLFWCWYIFDKGVENYYIETKINKSNFSFIKNIKMNLITNIRKNKKKLKPLKIKINNIENNLIYEEKISLKSILSILTCNDQNIVYIDDKIYYKNIVNTNNKTIYIYKLNDVYGVCINDIDHVYLDNNRLLIENIDKPLKTISNYKAPELREICKKMKINIMKSPTKYKTKNDLYLNLQEILL